MLAPSDVEAFQKHVLDWYAVNRRELPWRGDTDPYRILVSEVMLQQTSVARVLLKYVEFLQRFPTVRSLASASTGDVLRAWQGLGYNLRARNLKRAAEAVCEYHGGAFPKSIAELERLPGIGRYTARAVACFAFGAQVAVVDTNVRQVLYAFAGEELTVAETETLAAAMLPSGRAYDWNQALMDFGALGKRARTRRVAGATEPFASSNRFWRGRIVDALRKHSALPVPVLLQELTYPNRDESRVRALVRVLHEEGLVEYDASDDVVRLPV